MLKLSTVFPNVVNDCLGDEFIKEGTHVLVSSKFAILPSSLCSSLFVDKDHEQYNQKLSYF